MVKFRVFNMDNVFISFCHITENREIYFTNERNYKIFTGKFIDDSGFNIYDTANNRTGFGRVNGNSLRIMGLNGEPISYGVQ